MKRFLLAVFFSSCLTGRPDSRFCKVVVTRHPVCESAIHEETCAIFACPATAEEIAVYGVGQ